VRAVVISDGHLNVIDRQDPVPGEGELLVAVRAAGLNGADLIQRAGFYPAPPGSPPDIPGLELAGEVVAAGPGTTRFKPGDKVMSIVGGGGQAELAVVPDATAIAVPEGLSWEEAGGFAEVFVTAHDALFTQGGLQAGDRVLVTGAAGGVGLAGVQMAHQKGASVVASVRRPELRSAVAGFGATVVGGDGIAGSGPFDLVLELVGMPNVADDLRELATGGRIVVIGVGGGSRGEIDLFQIMSKRATLRGSTLRARPLADKAAATRAAARDLLPGLAAGSLKVPVEEAFDLEDVDAAYERFAAGGKLGKIILTMGAAR